MQEAEQEVDAKRQLEATKLRATFAKPGEKWVTNDWYEPKDPQGRTTRQILERKMREAHPELELRFDYDHIVGYRPDVMDGRTAAKDVYGFPDGEAAAIYGKLKTPPTPSLSPIQ